MAHFQSVRYTLPEPVSGEILGHVYLSWNADEHRWRMVTWQKDGNERETQAGTDPFEGGAAMLAELQQYAAAWTYFRQEVLDEHATRLAKIPPTAPAEARPGFRPKSVAALWHTICNAKRKEYAATVKSLEQACDKLLKYGWLTEQAGIVLPPLAFPEPWKKVS